MVSTSRKKTVNKRILFPIDRIYDSTSRNENFAKKIRFYNAEKLLSQARISKTTRESWLPIAGVSYSIKNGFTLI